MSREGAGIMTTTTVQSKQGRSAALIVTCAILLQAAWTRAEPAPGTVDEPRIIDAVPFALADDTSQAPSDQIDSYSCAPNLDESGPERVFRIEIPEPGRLVAWVVGDNYTTVDIDIHLLSSLDIDGSGQATACLARSNLAIEVDRIEPGTYYLVADTYVDNGTVDAGPYEIHVDFIAYDQWRERIVAKGVVWRHRLYQDLFGAFQSVNELVIDPDDPDVQFLPVRGDGCETVPSMAERSGGVAAVNAGFYTMNSTCPPVGLVKIDGNLLHANSHEKGSMGFSPDGGPLVDWIAAGADWPEAHDALGGSPMLVTDGAINVTADREGVSQEFVDLLAPRTAACIDADGKIRFVTFDGRTEAGGGITLTDLAFWLADQGCMQAVNYDGGGSTTMWVRGQAFGGVTNYPSDNRQPDHEGLRSVSTAWVVLAADFNHPPRFTTEPPTTATDQSVYSYDADALDLDMYDPLTFGLAQGPENATMDAESGELSWHPTWQDSTAHFVVTVTDGVNVTEQAFDLEVTVADTDSDGLPDGWENEYGTDPNKADADEDLDGDGVTNAEEFEQGTDPRDPDDPPRQHDGGLQDAGSQDAATNTTSESESGCSCRSNKSPSGSFPLLVLITIFGAMLRRKQ